MGVGRKLRVVRANVGIEAPHHDRERVVERSGRKTPWRRRSSSDRTSTSTAPSRDSAYASCDVSRSRPTRAAARTSSIEVRRSAVSIPGI
jgi:hypothetical protein